jgi:hypothetical protein
MLKSPRIPRVCGACSLGKNGNRDGRQVWFPLNLKEALNLAGHVAFTRPTGERAGGRVAAKSSGDS